jgi:hypothetical protein
VGGIHWISLDIFVYLWIPLVAFVNLTRLEDHPVRTGCPDSNHSLPRVHCHVAFPKVSTQKNCYVQVMSIPLHFELHQGFDGFWHVLTHRSIPMVLVYLPTWWFCSGKCWSINIPAPWVAYGIDYCWIIIAIHNWIIIHRLLSIYRSLSIDCTRRFSQIPACDIFGSQQHPHRQLLGGGSREL